MAKNDKIRYDLYLLYKAKLTLSMKIYIKGSNMQGMHKKGFTLLELAFVIVVIGILASVALPKFAMTRNDAEMATAKNTVAAVRSGLSIQRQKMILEGNTTAITTLSSSIGAGVNKKIFDAINGNTGFPLLQYDMYACENASDAGCWYTPDGVTYRYNLPVGGSVDFNVNNNRFNCTDPNDSNCIKLTR